MKTILYGLLLISACNELLAMEESRQLPSQQKLDHLLDMIGLSDFNEQTKFAKIIGG